MNGMKLSEKQPKRLLYECDHAQRHYCSLAYVFLHKVTFVFQTGLEICQSLRHLAEHNLTTFALNCPMSPRPTTTKKIMFLLLTIRIAVFALPCLPAHN